MDECAHERKHLTLDPDRNGNNRFRWQCLTCGESASRFIAKDKVIADGYAIEKLPLFDNELRERYWQAEQDRRDQEWSDGRAERVEAYREYLSSPRWRLKAWRVMERARGICEGCLVNRATQVHHKTYAHRENELAYELVALCNECHKVAHPEHQHEHS